MCKRPCWKKILVFKDDFIFYNHFRFTEKWKREHPTPSISNDGHFNVRLAYLLRWTHRVDALLLTKVHNLFRFVKFFYPVSFFFLCLRIPFRIPHHILLSCPLGSSRLWRFLRRAFFLVKWQFWGIPVTSFCRLLLYGQNRSAVFDTARWGLWVLRRKLSVIKCHFYHITSRVHAVNRIHCRWCWPWSLGSGCACQVSPPWRHASPPPPPASTSCSWEGSSRACAQPRPALWRPQGL